MKQRLLPNIVLSPLQIGPLFAESAVLLDMIHFLFSSRALHIVSA